MMKTDDITLKGFLETEVYNLQNGPNNLVAIERSGMEILELCGAILYRISIEFINGSAFAKPHSSFNEWCGDNNIRNVYAVKLLSDATLIGSSEDGAKEAKEEIINARTAYVRLLVLMRIHRDYMYAASDFLRLRLTHTLGVLRTQAESIGFIMLMQKDHKVTTNYMDPANQKSLHEKYNKRILATIKLFEFERYRDRAAELLVHSRMAGFVGGLTALNKDSSDGKEIVTKMCAQDLSDPVEIRLYLANFLEFYSRLFCKLGVVLPDVTFSTELENDIKKFRDTLGSIWKRLRPHADKRGWKK